MSFAAWLQVLQSAEQLMQVGVKEPESCPVLRSVAEFVGEVLYSLSFLKCSKGPDLSRVSAESDALR